MTTVSLAAALAVLGGLILAVQPAINVEAARHLGSGPAAVVLSLVMSLTVTAVWVAVARPPVQVGALMAAPWWIWLGGPIGAAFLLIALTATPSIGEAAFFLCLIVGPLIGSVLADHFGLVGLRERPLNWTRALGIALVMVGALLAVRGRG